MDKITKSKTRLVIMLTTVNIIIIINSKNLIINQIFKSQNLKIWVLPPPHPKKISRKITPLAAILTIKTIIINTLKAFQILIIKIKITTKVTIITIIIMAIIIIIIAIITILILTIVIIVAKIWMDSKSTSTKK